MDTKPKSPETAGDPVRDLAHAVNNALSPISIYAHWGEKLAAEHPQIAELFAKTTDAVQIAQTTVNSRGVPPEESESSEPPSPARSSGKQPEYPLFPAIECHKSGMLEAAPPHRLYWEESGNPDGIPVIFLHGGPGAGTIPAYRRFFNPKGYRIILMDQRGAGRSLPLADLTRNTTQMLIDDLEALRTQLNIDRWLVFGGSWGSTLALAYGQAHPQRCLGFILRGVFLFTAWEVEWFLNGMAAFFPDAARAFREFLPETERPFLLQSYYARLTDPDPAIHQPAAISWCHYENACSRHIPDKSPRRIAFFPGALAMARIEAHYMKNAGFMHENQLLDNMERIADLPAIIVQGRYDVVCPPRSATALVENWPRSELHLIEAAGHSSMDAPVRSALVSATETFRHLLE